MALDGREEDGVSELTETTTAAHQDIAEVLITEAQLAQRTAQLAELVRRD